MKLPANILLTLDHVDAVGFEERKRLVLTGVSTDSRSLRPGDLFVAIRGERFDAHNFVSSAVQAGAAAVIVDSTWAGQNRAMMISLNTPRLVVEDTVRALGRLANIYRRRFRIPVVAVGGSNGKTTTKEMVRRVLEQKYHVLATEGNLNNHIGVPMTLFRLDTKHRAAVVELGTNHPGEVAYLCGVAEPTHGLLTNIGHEHLEFFKSLQGVARAEGELFRWLEARKGTAFVNADDRHIVRQARGVKNSVAYSLEGKPANVRGSVMGMNEYACVALRVKVRGKKPMDIQLNIPGRHSAANALAAAAVGSTLKVPATGIRKGLEQFIPSGKRMQVLKLNNVTILDDTYNANPDSVTAALATLRAVRTSGKKMAVLADMLELGSNAELLHRKVGKAVASSGAQVLLTFGPLSRYTHDAAEVPAKYHYDQKNILAEFLLEHLAAGDVVLVKGSRGMRMDDVVAFLSERIPKAA